MSLFGCKQIYALCRLVAVIAAILCIARANSIASPITAAPGIAGGTVAVPVSPNAALQDLSPSTPDAEAAGDDTDLHAIQPSLSELLRGHADQPTLRSMITDLPVHVLPRVGNVNAGDETLRQVLGALVTRHVFEPTTELSPDFDPSTDGALSATKSGNPRTKGSQGILDSRPGGRLLRELIDVQAETNRSVVFSVLGMGNFVLEKSAGAGTVTLSEVSSGWSATLSPNYDDGSADPGAPNYGTPITGSHSGGNALLLALQSISDFLLSPLGIVLLMIAGVIAILTCVVRFTVFLRNQAAQKRRSRRRRRRRRWSTSSTTRSKSGQAIR